MTALNDPKTASSEARPVKPYLSRLAIREEIGIAIGDDEIAVSLVAVTPLGPVEVVRDRVGYEPDALAPALEAVLSKNFTPRTLARTAVHVGLPALRVFFSTRPAQAESLQASPQVILHEVIQSPNLNVDDMVVDMIRARPGPRPVASLVSCRKKYLAAVLAALEAAGVTPARVEPSPFALLREAARKAHPPRKSRAHLRVLLGRGRGLAVLMAGDGMPMMWREFSLEVGAEGASILAVVAALKILSPYCGLDASPDALLIHGRPDLVDLADLGRDPAAEGMKILRCEEPEFDEESAARGLARGVGDEVEAFNLTRTLGRPGRFLNIFPWGQAAAMALALIGLTIFLQGRLTEHRRAARVARAEDSRHAWAAKLPAPKLQAEKKALGERVGALKAFVESRIAWSRFARDLTGRLPSDLALTGFEGMYELDAPGSKSGKPKRSLLLRLVAPIPRTGAMPKEIDDFLRLLRDQPLLKAEFPEVELADLRWTQTGGGQPRATFSVRCAPAKAGGPAPAEKGKGKAKAR